MEKPILVKRVQLLDSFISRQVGDDVAKQLIFHGRLTITEDLSSDFGDAESRDPSF
jgi:hypothetical protein